MGRTKVSEELAARWVHLRQKGLSFRSIARGDGVDARTVQTWVQRAGEEKEKQHWDAVSRQVDAKYLDEHYRLLLQTAVALLAAVHADPVLPHESDSEHLLRSSIQPLALQAAEILKGRGMNLEPVRRLTLPAFEIREDRAGRLSRKLLDALMEHEPQVKMAIDRWRGCWSEFQQACQELAEAAKNLFQQKKVPARIVEDLKREVVREGLGNKLLGNPPWESRVEQRDGGKAALVRYCPETKTEKTVCKGSEDEIKAAFDAYGSVLQQVSHEERVRPAVNAYRSLEECIHSVEDLVDRLVLMGKPQGQCPLCPHYSIRLSAGFRTRKVS